MQPMTIAGERQFFTYHKKSSDLKSFVYGLMILIGLFEMPPVAMFGFYITNMVGKWIAFTILGGGILAVVYLLPSLLLARHSIEGAFLIIRFGKKFKGVIPLSNIKEFRLVNNFAHQGLLAFDVKYIREQDLLSATAGNKNQVLIELKTFQKFRIDIGKPFHAEKILIGCDDPEAFIKAVQQRLSALQGNCRNIPTGNNQAAKRSLTETVEGMLEALDFERPMESTGSEWALQTQSLMKCYGTVKAVDKIGLYVKPGEIFGFLGPNGAGKTTTMNMVVGLLKPSAGSVRVFGHDIWKEPLIAKRFLAYVAENPILYDRLTGREFIKFSAELYGASSTGLEERTEQLLVGLNLTEAADTLIGTYSQGMRRKTAIAAAIVHNPRLLVLDEPTNGVDPKGAWVIKNLLRGLSLHGTAVFMSTHVLDVAENMCDRVAIINKGSLVAMGTIGQLKEQSTIPNSNLEEIFLTLTEPEHSQERFVDK